GMAFVVILHLSPDHESIIPSLLQRFTQMPVSHAQNGDKVEANHVYVIPPGKHLTAADGHLRLTELQPERGKRVTVDLFFRSLADTHGPHSMAIVLSGADGDGALGIKRIKERGGLTVAQDPDEAEHPSMPDAAIKTGMVDWVLRVAEMPQRLIDYCKREQQLKMPSEDGPQPASPLAPLPGEDEEQLREVLAFLRTRTGREFSYYKRATIVRRIGRRMQVNALSDLGSYLNFLRTHPGESGALLQDLLISVTNFFRDREAFRAFETQIPYLFRGKKPGDAVRVWVPACATGEEAYSVAMLLLEHARTISTPPNIQIFGCDLDENAIQVARTGIYPKTIEADVSEERLRRFFIKDHNGYRVRTEVREIALFAVHDLLKDPPFSRMDLVSCRNLMIYLSREAQRSAEEIFHFALRPEGRLFLGTSETVDDSSTLFTVLDKKSRIYAKSATSRNNLPLPIGPGLGARARHVQETAREGPVIPGRSFLRGAMLPYVSATPLGESERVPSGELHFKLIERLAPPSVVVNHNHEIVHLSEKAGRFLQFSGGEPTMNLLRIVHPMLRVDLRAALFRAAETASPVESAAVPLDLDGIRQSVDIRVAPAEDLAPGFFIVVFDSRTLPVSESIEGGRTEPTSVVEHLEREIEQLKDRLRETVEQYEVNGEELKASNEEL
ncbi:MAG: histidine kinase, partial [Verrucomicrobiaceae bacterium]